MPGMPHYTVMICVKRHRHDNVVSRVLLVLCSFSLAWAVGRTGCLRTIIDGPIQFVRNVICAGQWF
jgi:hypothetical protein